MTPNDGEVHLWSMGVDRTIDQAASLALLDGSERARAGRFRLPRDRDRYVVRHAFKRRVLAWYVGVAPARLAIRVAPGGRPELESPRGIDWNMSDSDGLAVVAVTRRCRVGVDIECLRQLDDALDLADTYMTAREGAWLRSLAPHTRSRAFLKLWTQKEAVVKALGAGLSMPLDSFEATPSDAHGVTHPTGVPGGATWSAAELEGLGGYVGSVAVEGTHVRVVMMGELEVAA